VPPFCGGGGGGGGAGAAGGGAGGPGGDGGSSVGLYLVESDVDVSDDLIVTGNGKDGGRGGLGAASGLGGGGGRGGARFGAQGAGGSGGRGGDGGHGGDAGSGGGGGSVGILLDGSVAILSGNTFEIGAAGRGGWNEAADPSTRGSDGVRAELHSFDELDRQSASD
jgi:hypothetical protein